MDFLSINAEPPVLPRECRDRQGDGDHRRGSARGPVLDFGRVACLQIVNQKSEEVMNGFDVGGVRGGEIDKTTVVNPAASGLVTDRVA